MRDRCEIWAVDEEKVALAKQRLLSDESFVLLAEIFRALADPNRTKIVYSLLEQELCVCDIACVVGISESAVSQHLRILRTLRLGRQGKGGRRVLDSLRHAALP